MFGKKILVSTFAVLISASFLLTSCGNNESDDKNILVVYHDFSDEQKDFLKTIGVEGVEKAEKTYDNRYVFKFKDERVTVYLNEKKGIVKVTEGYDDKLIWDDKNGKIDLFEHEKKEERKRFLYNFIDNAKQSYDQANQVTWVDSYSSPYGHKGVMTYMGIKGREKTGSKWLRAKLHYSDSSWVFFDKVVFSNTKEAWTFEIENSFDIKRDVVWGGIHETYDVPFSKIEKGLKILINGENPRIDFIGSHGRDGVNVSEDSIENFKTYIKLQEAIYDEI